MMLAALIITKVIIITSYTSYIAIKEEYFTSIIITIHTIIIKTLQEYLARSSTAKQQAPHYTHY